MTAVVLKKAVGKIEVFIDGEQLTHVADVRAGWSDELMGFIVAIERRPPGKIEVVKFVPDSLSYS